MMQIQPERPARFSHLEDASRHPPARFQSAPRAPKFMSTTNKRSTPRALPVILHGWAKRMRV
eukprot:3963680-Pyramimonas_sp.AAC.1